MPEVVYVGRLDKEKLISGWDIPHSLENLQGVIEQIHSKVMSLGVPVVVDSTTQVLLQRMSRIAKLIGLLSLLIALPLLWMAWLFAGNLSGLLMLNERRKLGLMRLRGVPGQLIGRTFLISISVGGVLGGVLGMAIGSVFSLIFYEGKVFIPCGAGFPVMHCPPFLILDCS
jgi:cell division protein FtsX